MPTTPPLPDEPGSGEGLLKPIERPAPPTTGQPAATSSGASTPGGSPAMPSPAATAAPAAPRPASTRRPTAIPHLNGSAATPTGQAAGATTATRTPMNEPFNEGHLNLTWDSFIHSNPTAHILVNTMKASRPKLIENASFAVIVENEKQVEILTKASDSLLAYLRHHLRNDSVAMEIHLNQGVSSPRTWNQREVYAHMLESNPALQAFVDEFKLNLI